MGTSWILPAWIYLPLAVLALGGLWLVWWALWSDRAKGRRRCPRCWYDMRGTPSLRCPECGNAARDEADLVRARRRWGCGALALLPIVALSVFFGVRDGRRVWYMLPPKWVTEERITAGSVHAVRQRLRDPDERGGRVVLSQNGRMFLNVEDAMVEIGEDGFSASPRTGAGDDLNGDGVPELVVFAYSGGAHCCYTVYVVECSSPARVVATIDAQNGMGFERGEGGEVLFNISDQSFDYWHTSHAGSPFPSVYYRLKNHRLEIALEKMIKPPTGAPDLSVGSDAGSPGSASQLSPAIWGYMLDMLYSGNEDACWMYFDGAWPKGVAGKDEFKADFLKTLSQSRQWKDFQAARAAALKGETLPGALVGEHRPESP